MNRIALMLLGLSAACSKESPKPSEAEPPAAESLAAPGATPPTAASLAASASPSASHASAVPPTPQSSVKLLDHGHEPLRPLRYAWHVGQNEQMAIELRTTVSAETGDVRRDVPLAPLNITVAIEPTSVTPDADLRFAWHVTSATTGATDAGASSAQVTEGWSAQLVPVEHLSGTGVVTSRGVSKNVTLDPGTAGDAGPDAEMVVQVVQMLRDVAAPLPDDPVGKGARWQKLSTLDAKNGHATQTDTYTLVDLQGDKGSLDDVLAQTASPQALPVPAGMAPGPQARVDSLLTSGSAKTQFDLSRLVPQTALDGTTSMAVSAPSSRMNMVMRLGITVRGTSLATPVSVGR